MLKLTKCGDGTQEVQALTCKRRISPWTIVPELDQALLLQPLEGLLGEIVILLVKTDPILPINTLG